MHSRLPNAAARLGTFAKFAFAIIATDSGCRSVRRCRLSFLSLIWPHYLRLVYCSRDPPEDLTADTLRVRRRDRLRQSVACHPINTHCYSPRFLVLVFSFLASPIPRRVIPMPVHGAETVDPDFDAGMGRMRRSEQKERRKKNR
jgi:hypothetical protein